MSLQIIPSRALTAESAEALEQNFIVDNDVTIREPVYTSSPGEVSPGDASVIASSKVIGFALSSQVSTEEVRVRKAGSISGFVGLTPNERVFLAEGGGTTQTRPTTLGSTVVQLGTARDSTTIDIDIQQLVRN